MGFPIVELPVPTQPKWLSTGYFPGWPKSWRISNTGRILMACAQLRYFRSSDFTPSLVFSGRFCWRRYFLCHFWIFNYFHPFGWFTKFGHSHHRVLCKAHFANISSIDPCVKQLLGFWMAHPAGWWILATGKTYPQWGTFCIQSNTMVRGQLFW